MKYVMVAAGAAGAGATGRDGRLRLDDGAVRERVCEDCREAALAFMTGAARGWDKIDLALWLTGPYARAVRHAHVRESHRESHALLGGEAELADVAVCDLVSSVREQVLAGLENAALQDGELGFVERVVARGLVQRATDGRGRDVWVPVDTPRAKLRDRVQSLFAADYLSAPVEYSQLYVCHYCESVVFDVDAKQRSMCRAHRSVSVSGIVPGLQASEASSASEHAARKMPSNRPKATPPITRKSVPKVVAQRPSERPSKNALERTRDAARDAPREASRDEASKTG